VPARAWGFESPLPHPVGRIAGSAFDLAAGGADHALVGFAGGRPVALLFLAGNHHGLKPHWRTVKQVMVDPAAWGRGHEAALMREAERVPRTRGWSALHVTVLALA
jgi:GNAT superfamily N-acetyltransferase